jgi:hypothetical protein
LARKKKQYRAPPAELPKTKPTLDQIPEEVIRYIISAGIQAPSGDNCQPWRFSSQDNKIFLHLDRDADHSFFNFRQMASIISGGAVLENMRIAATAFGMDADVMYLPPSGQDDRVAAVELIQDDIARHALLDCIWKRHTNRTFYGKKPLPSELLDDLRQSISDLPGTTLHFVTEESALRIVAKMIYKVDRIRTEHRSLHEHLCKMLRYTHEEAMETRDGLPLKNLEAGFAGEIFLRITRPWWVMNLANKICLGRLVALHSYQGILNSSGVAVLTVDGMDPERFLKGGQALERIWLSLTQQGLDMQPMTAITLFWLRWQTEGEEDFSRKHRGLLRGVWEAYQNLFPDVDFSSEGQVMLFRLGFGKEIKHGTFRKDVGTFLI